MVSRILLALACCVCFAVPLAAEPLTERPLTFERDIRPIFKANCFQCHGEGEETKGNLDLRLRRLAVAGGDTGAAIEPGKLDDSPLYERIVAGEMPPGKKKLTKGEVETIGRWITAGAVTARPEPEKIGAEPLLTEEDRSFWAFQPVRVAEVPAVKDTARVRNSIDAFLLKGLEERGLSFSPEADKRTLIRRATFDLLGLPPTLEEIELFLADDASDAYERLLDRLLASPHYGERWGRHWLDVAGYADSEGYTEADTERKHAWRYRDYVIRSLNADKPFDQFILEQLAGDELLKPPYTNLSPEDADKLIATGFLRMAPDGTGSGGVDRKLASNEVVADTLKIVSSSLLGLTVGCAQCHDHRYDPIPQADYYRLRAIFEPAFNWKEWRLPQQRLVSMYTADERKAAQDIETEAAKIDAVRNEQQQKFILETLEKEIAKLDEDLREPARAAWNTPAAKRTPEQQKLLKEHPTVNVSAGSLYLYDKKAADELKKMTDEAAAVRAKKPTEGFIQALTEVPGKLPPTHLFARGDYDQPKQPVTPAELAVLTLHKPASIPEDDAAIPTSGRRLAYARWLTSSEHPLTARVLVNRVWLHHFGKGIVATPADFGILGERPTHPELLDWLAATFVSGQHPASRVASAPGGTPWSLKQLHRLIMLSTAYRQSSVRSPEHDKIDPDNKLYGRQNVRRLDAESLRDAVLSQSGHLNKKMFGAPVPVMADEVGQFVIGIENLDAGRPKGVLPMGGEEFRRSVYVQVRRSRPLSMLTTFDAPAMEPNCSSRNVSTVAPQSLLMMNNDFIVGQAEKFARRVQGEAGTNPELQATRAWKLALGAEPTKAELEPLTKFLADQTEYYRKQAESAAKPQATAKSPVTDPALQALATLCQALWSSNGYLYVD